MKITKPSLQQRIKRRCKEEIKRGLQKVFGIHFQRKVRVSGYSRPKKADMILAYKYCIGKGVEIGPGSNRFPNIQTVSVDLLGDFKGRVYSSPDYIGMAYDLHFFEDNSMDFIFHSHLLEHLLNPIKAIQEWIRVVKPGGYFFMIIPDKNLIPLEVDNRAKETELSILIENYEKDLVETMDDNPLTSNCAPSEGPRHGAFDPHGMPGWRHFHYWTSKSIVELLQYVGLEIVKVVEAKDKNTGLDVKSYSWDDFTVVSKVIKN